MKSRGTTRRLVLSHHRVVKTVKGEPFVAKPTCALIDALFQPKAFFHFGMAQARLAVIAQPRFGQIEVIVQILEFFAKCSDLLALPSDRAERSFLSDFSHKRLSDDRSCESQ